MNFTLKLKKMAIPDFENKNFPKGFGVHGAGPPSVLRVLRADYMDQTSPINRAENVMKTFPGLQNEF